MQTSELVKIVLYVIVLAIAARISIDIPMTSINITAQTLALLTMACVFPFRVVALASVLYLVVGIAGLPVFSEGNHGWEYFTGGSLGYFIGFVLSSILLSYLLTFKIKNFPMSIFMFLHLIGTIIILCCGVLNLSLSYGFTKAISVGLTPFIIAGSIKSILGGWLSFLIVYYRNASKAS